MCPASSGHSGAIHANAPSSRSASGEEMAKRITMDVQNFELTQSASPSHSAPPLPRRRRVLGQLVADDPAALHHDLDALKLGDVRQRIARDRDEIGIFTLLDRPDLALPPT